MFLRQNLMGYKVRMLFSNFVKRLFGILLILFQLRERAKRG
jgi:hypothetical protein